MIDGEQKSFENDPQPAAPAPFDPTAEGVAEQIDPSKTETVTSDDPVDNAIQKAIDARAITATETDNGKTLNLNVLVEADAIQAEGFADAAAAWTAFDAQN